MPWTGAEFKKKHAKHLSDAQAEKAAAQANAMLKSGTDEGVAIATAIKAMSQGERSEGEEPAIGEA